MKSVKDVQAWNNPALPRPGTINAEDCPNRRKHTKCPEGYLAWHEWAERKARTHDSTQCFGCGLWAIWVPKRARKGEPR